MTPEQALETLRGLLDPTDYDLLDVLADALAEREGYTLAMTVVPSDQFEREKLRADAAVAERDKLSEILQNGVEIATHYMDTDGRGDLDGWIDAARAALGSVAPAKERQG